MTAQISKTGQKESKRGEKGKNKKWAWEYHLLINSYSIPKNHIIHNLTKYM